jgi:hypothetical protein
MGPGWAGQTEGLHVQTVYNVPGENNTHTETPKASIHEEIGGHTWMMGPCAAGNGKGKQAQSKQYSCPRDNSDLDALVQQQA